MDSSDDEPQIKTAQRRKKPINKRTKVHIKFDEDARREFLTGFRKRKLQRKKAAQEEFERLLKEEKKRIKSEAKEQYKKLVKSYKPIPELEKTLAKEYEVDDSKVSVLELDTDLLAETNFMIGRNKVKYDDAEEEDESKDEQDEKPEIEGMNLQTKQEVPISSKKELQKLVKRQAGETVKNSKLFQKKNQMERVKQKKMEARKKKAKKKVKSKKQKHGRKKR